MGYDSQKCLPSPSKYTNAIQDLLDPPVSRRPPEATWLCQAVFPLVEGESVARAGKAWYHFPVSCSILLRQEMAQHSQAVISELGGDCSSPQRSLQPGGV